MELFLISMLMISVVGMVSLLAIKQYELSSGKLFFAPIRPGLNSFFARLAHLGNKILPALVRQYVERVVRIALSRLQLALAHAIVKIERTLESALSLVKEKTENYMDLEPSAFLREVADHKKTLVYKKTPVRKPKLKKVEAHATVQEPTQE